MTVAELMAGYTPNKAYKGPLTADDLVVAIDTTEEKNATVTAYSVFGVGVTEQSASLNAETKTTQYIRQGASTTKTGTQRTVEISGTVYAGEPAIDFILSRDIKYGTGAAVVVPYVLFNVRTGMGEKGEATITVNTDASGAAGDDLGFSAQLQKNGAAPVEFDYSTMAE